MPAPATTSQFLDLLRKSNLVEPDCLDSFLAAHPDADTANPAHLAARLVSEGLLTDFHMRQLLEGRWRGFTIGKYKVLERLGSGGMGVVYLCEHQVMEHQVAVKVLPLALAENPAVLKRFYREAKAMGTLDHPNLVKAHDIDQDGDRHFLVMDFVDGLNLQHLVAKKGPLSPLRAAHYVRQAAVALGHAQKVGLVHRDIKPGNLLLDRSGTIRLLDLGLARFFHDNQDLLTLQYNEGSVLGTADYVAPEQTLDSHGVDIRADLYSLGGTFYFLLAGHPPFPEGTKTQKLIWHQTIYPKSIRELRPDVPKGLAAVLEKMLAKKPAERYQTAAEAIDALAPFTQTPIPPPCEDELPQLSPAVRRTQGMRAGLSSSHGNGGPDSSDTRLAPVPPDTPVPVAPRALEPALPANGRPGMASRSDKQAARPRVGTLPASGAPAGYPKKPSTLPATAAAPPQRATPPTPAAAEDMPSFAAFQQRMKKAGLTQALHQDRILRVLLIALILALGAGTGIGLHLMFTRASAPAEKAPPTGKEEPDRTNPLRQGEPRRSAP